MLGDVKRSAADGTIALLTSSSCQCDNCRGAATSLHAAEGGIAAERKTSPSVASTAGL